jgi:hypothetical protein
MRRRRSAYLRRRRRSDFEGTRVARSLRVGKRLPFSKSNSEKWVHTVGCFFVSVKNK